MSEISEPGAPVAGEPDPRRRIIDAAREIIRETGTFDMPMRTLSARARVSMTRPYTLFQSKSGVVAAILAEDEVRFARQRAAVTSVDLIEEHFDSLRLGMNFYGSDQPFYRALFRMTWDSAHGGGDPTRLNHPVFLRRMKAAREAGLLRDTIDPDAFADVLTDLFSAGVRAWARLDWDVERLHAKLGYGYALAFAGAGSPRTAERMVERITRFERELRRWAAG
jgi:AcrR family transcriptional regulator